MYRTALQTPRLQINTPVWFPVVSHVPSSSDMNPHRCSSFRGRIRWCLHLVRILLPAWAPEHTTSQSWPITTRHSGEPGNRTAQFLCRGVRLEREGRRLKQPQQTSQKHNTTPPDAKASAHSPAMLGGGGVKRSGRLLLHCGLCGQSEQENRVVLPNLSRTAHLRGLDSFPDIVPLARRKVTASCYQLHMPLPLTPFKENKAQGSDTGNTQYVFNPPLRSVLTALTLILKPFIMLTLHLTHFVNNVSDYWLQWTHTKNTHRKCSKNNMWAICECVLSDGITSPRVTHSFLMGVIFHREHHRCNKVDWTTQNEIKVVISSFHEYKCSHVPFRVYGEFLDTSEEGSMKPLWSMFRHN